MKRRVGNYRNYRKNAYSVLMLCVLAAGCGPTTVAPVAAPAPPVQWQYDIQRVEEIPQPWRLNSHGEHGWELFQIIEHKDGEYLLMCYKRPKQ